MQISNEVLIGLIAIVTTVLGAWAYTEKRKADAALEKARAATRESDARADQIETESKARLIKVQADTSQSQNIMKLFEQQITINQQYRQLLAQARRSNESNYRVLVNTQNDNTRMLLTEMQLEHKMVIGAISGLPEKLQEQNKLMVQTVAGEIAVTLAEQIRIQSLNQDLFPFPDSSDPAWEELEVQALSDNVRIRKQPYFDEKSVLESPYAFVKPQGEKLRVIRGRLKGWLIVHKKANGNPPAWGWVRENMVKIMEGEKQTA